MDTRFLVHNSHLENPQTFVENDPHLRQLQQQKYVHHPALLEQLPMNTPGIYTVGGGRQIGKTTALKQWMAKLLAAGAHPQAIAFLTGELIDDHHTLLRLLQDQLAAMPQGQVAYLLLDEVTYIRDWDKGIKFAADAGLLENIVCILTGSDLILMQEARMRFPGRRGKSDQVNFHLYPLSFREVIGLKRGNEIVTEILEKSVISEDTINLLFDEFQQYLCHGGYLTAINDIAAQGSISIATLATYSDWIRGDVIKRGRQEHYLREILNAIIKRYNNQITWNALSHDLSIDHPKTVADYAALLESMDALFVQAALLEDKLIGAPKKARKLMFTDPFIFHAVRAWLHPITDPFNQQILPAINDPKLCSELVEACVATHYRRFYPTYYIKAEGEVDIAYVDQQRFWPVEVKWTNQLRTKDLKQIAKYKNSIILNKTKQNGYINGIRTEPLPLALLKLG